LGSDTDLQSLSLNGDEGVGKAIHKKDMIIASEILDDTSGLVACWVGVGAT
jgi:hypothetical protein